MFNQRLTFVLIHFIVYCISSSKQDSWFLETLRKIYAGRSVNIKEHPYIVSIIRNNIFRCGGVLITDKCVLTAAHCLEDLKEVHNLRVFGGRSCQWDYGESKSVSHLKIHSEYLHTSSLDNDIAVLKLQEPYKKIEKTQPIAIDYRPLEANDSLTIAGWGQTEKYVHSCLMAANVRVTSVEECEDTTGRRNPVTNNMFCALGVDKVDACPGDSGGPAIHNGKLVGIVSWGIGCGSGYPGVYVRLSSEAVSLFLNETVPMYCLK